MLKGEKKITGYGDKKISAVFGSHVFSGRALREYLSEEAHKSLMSSVKLAQRIDRKMADQVAAGMKLWAEERGVTHFTHWFQPLTGSTAEKHDSFFTIKSDGTAIELFGGDKFITGLHQRVEHQKFRRMA